MIKIAEVSKLLAIPEIQNFENTLILIHPNSNLRRIKTEFNLLTLIKPRLFRQNLQCLVARVLKQNDRWDILNSITSHVLMLDRGKDYFSPEREHELAVARVLKGLYKKGIIERQEIRVHQRVIKRGFFRRSEWRLKPLEQE